MKGFLLFCPEVSFVLTIFIAVCTFSWMIPHMEETLPFVTTTETRRMAAMMPWRNSSLRYGSGIRSRARLGDGMAKRRGNISGWNCIEVGVE